MRAICVNHHCPRFEYPVSVSDDVADAETERCEECGQLLCHESGLTFRDAVLRETQRDLDQLGYTILDYLSGDPNGKGET